MSNKRAQYTWTLESMQSIQTFWWDEANKGNRMIQIRQLLDHYCVNAAHGPVRLDGCSIAPFGKGDLSVSDSQGRIVVSTAKRLYIPGDWEKAIDKAFAGLEQKRQELERQQKQKETDNLRESLLLDDDDMHQRALDALNQMRAMQG